MKSINRKYHYLYKTTNTVTGDIYVGARSTDTPIEQDTYLGSGKYLKRAIKRYGADLFNKEILEVFSSSLDLYKAEAATVTEAFVLREDTYNLKVGGYGGGSPRTKETREKMSKTRTGRKHSEEHRKAISNALRGCVSDRKGKRITEEHRQNIIKAKQGTTGRSQSESTRDKISRTMKAKSKSTVVCPHCSIEGNVVNMRRWHFNNCKQKDYGKIY